MTRLARMAWALAVVVLLAGSTACQAADKEVKIGIVDVQKVYKDAPRVKQYMEELELFRDGLKTKLDIRSQNIMLDENEIKSLIELKMKSNSTDEDKAKIKELEDTERARDTELKTLQETKEPNDQQKARLTELQELQQKSRKTGGEIAKDYDSQWQTAVQESDGKIAADLLEAVKKVAEAKGFTLILDKIAVPFGGVDVTSDVIAKLDRKMQ